MATAGSDATALRPAKKGVDELIEEKKSEERRSDGGQPTPRKKVISKGYGVSEVNQRLLPDQEPMADDNDKM